ncbi:diacylglycerol kinase beta [Pimephales promelas]|nr:diacylglycerol kinase beta [Pimephales promelas]
MRRSLSLAPAFLSHAHFPIDTDTVILADDAGTDITCLLDSEKHQAELVDFILEYCAQYTTKKLRDVLQEFMEMGFWPKIFKEIDFEGFKLFLENELAVEFSQHLFLGFCNKDPKPSLSVMDKQRIMDGNRFLDSKKVKGDVQHV